MSFIYRFLPEGQPSHMPNTALSSSSPFSIFREAQLSDVQKSQASPSTSALLSKQILPALITLAIAWALWDKFTALDKRAIVHTLSLVTAPQWIGALCTTAGSFWAIGQYDIILHAQLNTGISPRRARHSGIAAIGLAQFLGFGALTGTLVRWRMLPELSFWQTARLSAAVALSFLAGWAIVASLAVLVLQPDIPWMKTLAITALVIAAGIVSLSILPPARLTRIPWPTLRTICAILSLTAVDTLLAGLTLYILLPPEAMVSIAQLLSAHLFALGAGLIGATPGGLGPFETLMTSLLPSISIETLLGAILAYRLVYYLLPACVAAALTMRGPRQNCFASQASITPTPATAFLSPKIERELFFAARAEANLLRTPDFDLITDTSGTHLGLAASIGQSLIMLSDPMTEKTQFSATREALEQTARSRFRIPALYKCGARMASCLREANWSVLPTAQEAWLAPSTFTTQGASKRQLRRQLKKAQTAGVTVKEAGSILPLTEMDRIAQDWKDMRGSERGFSMGKYNHDYVSCQRVFLAYQNNTLIAFITLHETRHEMTLDLMRNTPQTPDGTVQMLLVHAIEAAKAYGCPRLSLAAVPWQGRDANSLVRAARRALLKKSNHAGLRRIKSSFDPNWETLYIAAPHPFALMIASIDILRRVTAPTPSEKYTSKILGLTSRVKR